MLTPKRPSRVRTLRWLLLVLLSASAHAQTLAQRNWAGSDVSAEPWWRRAVFYRIDPAKFQDSDGDGQGDLAGIAQRLDYLQALGVDALILDPGTEANSQAGLAPTGLDDLTRTAVGHHLRVLVALGVPASQAPAADAQYLALARSWLNQGAAGLYVPTRALQKVDGTAHIAALLHQLRGLTNSFPGTRVLIAGPPATADTDLARALLKETQLAASAPLSLDVTSTASAQAAAAPTAGNLRAQLEAALSGPPGAAAAANPLLLTARPTPLLHSAAQDVLLRTAAAMLLASRSAVILEYGQELGLNSTAAGAPRMQWTPGNITRKTATPADKGPEPASPPKPAFEEFHPFIPPPRKDLLPPPKMPIIVVSDDPQPVVQDADSLPGFTTGTLDTIVSASNGVTANVALEQADPKSLLNFYRQLIQLHHDNAAVRNGTQTLLNHDSEDALVWVRRSPAGGRTSASVVVVCRLGGSAGDPGTRLTRPLVGLVSDAVFVAEGHFAEGR